MIRSRSMPRLAMPRLAMRWLALSAILFLLLPVRHGWAVSSPSEMLPDPAQEHRAEAIGSQLRCLVCQNQSIEDSEADLARDLRAKVRQRVAAGDNDAQVIAWMEARYGEFVRLRPPFSPLTWLLWLSPVFALGIGAVIVLAARRKRTTTIPPLNDDEKDRLNRLLRP
ncbi:cytochrome c-type biogenesis protein [Granulibacter bethesdensis]|uniref:cytochrome c-type biogenesis protein n=1 Tax=Granulibacter bethesdensis TaxID=364410 RepID=UPI00090AA2B7|nr:Cytochrome c-type biogenesis protein ccmH [Granulibacter bethesdensis]